MTGLRTGELARAAGVNQQTLRYYERRGLLPEPARSNGGHRLYDEQSVTVLRVIKAAQRLGFTLDEVAELLEMGRHHHGRHDHGLAVKARAKLSEVEARIADLNMIRERLRATIDAGCDDLMECVDTGGCPIPFADLPSTSSSVRIPLPAQPGG